MKQIMPALAFAIIIIISNQTFAGNKSLVTLAVGSQMGIAHFEPSHGNGGNLFVTELNVRLRLVKFIGLEFTRNIAGEYTTPSGEVFGSNYRVAGLLYVVPTNVFSLYLASGTGTTTVEEISSAAVNRRSYFAGLGTEIYAGDHWTLSAEFLFVVPEVERIVVSQQPLTLDAAGAEQWELATTPSVTDYVKPDNFQINVGLRWYF